MSSTERFDEYAKILAGELVEGRLTEAAGEAREFMAQYPETVLDGIGLLCEATRDADPYDALIEVHALLLASGLETVRFQVERGRDWAVDLADAVRSLVEDLAEDGRMTPRAIVVVLNCFHAAGLEPGEELRALAAGLTLDPEVDAGSADPSEFHEMMEQVVEQAGGNPFAVHQFLTDATNAMPVDIRARMIEAVLNQGAPAVRDAAMLSLLDPAPEVRRRVREVVGGLASPDWLSPESLRRMIDLRNWLPADEREGLDEVVKAARRRNVPCASRQPAKIREVMASAADGAGAQSVFVVVKTGRRHTLASLLVKQGVGVADAWCLPDQTLAEIRKVKAMAASEISLMPASMEFLDRLLPHYLAVGLDAGTMVPSGLLDFAETAGIENWQPSRLSPAALIEVLEKDLAAERLDEAAVAAALDASGDWMAELVFTESWFEDDAEVEKVLERKSKARLETGVKAVLDGILEKRRDKWTERLLWTALWLREDADMLSPWVDFLLVGRELHRGRAMKEIPLMADIAEETVTAQQMGGMMIY